MTVNERLLIIELMRKKISKEAFKSAFAINTEMSKYVKRLLNDAYENRQADDVEYLLIVGFEFNLFDKDWTTTLCDLLEQRWHYQHENIARILQALKTPESIDCLYQTALSKFDYLEYNDSTSLAIKCIWALGDINTAESRKKLKLLQQSNEPIIKDNATKQLNRIIFMK